MAEITSSHGFTNVVDVYTKPKGVKDGIYGLSLKGGLGIGGKLNIQFDSNKGELSVSGSGYAVFGGEIKVRSTLSDLFTVEYLRGGIGFVAGAGIGVNGGSVGTNVKIGVHAGGAVHPLNYSEYGIGGGGYLKGGINLVEKHFEAGASGYGYHDGIVGQAHHKLENLPKCFEGGTPIHTSDGWKRISEVEIGDLVYSFDSNSHLGRGELVLKPVTRLYRNVTDEWVRLTWQENGRERELITTPGHHFLDEFGDFPIIESILRNGMANLVTSSGELVAVSATKIRYSADTAHLFEQAQSIGASSGNAALQPVILDGWQTYNFEVADHHTYIANDIRVHNISEYWAHDFERHAVFTEQGEFLGVELSQYEQHLERFSQNTSLPDGYAEQLARAHTGVSNGGSVAYTSSGTAVSLDQDRFDELYQNSNKNALDIAVAAGRAAIAAGHSKGWAMAVANNQAQKSGLNIDDGHVSGQIGRGIKLEQQRESGSSGKADPIILDLDGDGIEISPQDQNFTLFDFDDDGFKERTAWVSSDDGLLMYDHNDDGQITSAKEIAFAEWMQEDGQTDLEALAKYFDVNGDGLLNNQDISFGVNDELVTQGLVEAGDVVWGNFKVWQDLDGDAEIDAGELKTLDDWSISELKLNAIMDEAFVLSDGSVVNGFFDVTINGQNQLGGDVAFSYSTFGLSENIDSNGNQLITFEDGDVSNTKILGINETNFNLGDETSDWQAAIGNDEANFIDASQKTSNVQLNGGSGDDALFGGAGDDIIVGMAGVDILNGNDGDDMIIIDALDNLTNISGGAGYDTLVVTGTNGIGINVDTHGFESVYGSDNIDNINGDDDDLSVYSDYASFDENGNPIAGIVSIGYYFNGFGGNDILDGANNGDQLIGGEGDDTITGHGGDDYLAGGQGVDYILGGDGDDTVVADENDSWFSGDAGIDTLVFESDVDFDYALSQGAFENAQFGSGNNKIWGNSSNNMILAGAGDDTVWGYAGDDYIEGGEGIDSLMGGDGNDTIVAEANDSWYSGGDGIDTLIVTGDGGIEYAMTQGAFENAEVNAGNNKIWGTSADNQIVAGDGDDSIWGFEGNDYIQGGAGVDTLLGGDGDDTVVAETTDAWFSGGDGTDSLIIEDDGDLQYAMTQGAFENMQSGGGNDTIWGTSGNNIIYGGDGNDQILGYDGNDIIVGDAGDDIVTGGTGDDRFLFDFNNGNDIIGDFQAGVGTDDVIVFTGADSIGSFAEVLANATDDGTHTTISLASDSSIRLDNVLVSQLHQQDFQFESTGNKNSAPIVANALGNYSVQSGNSINYTIPSNTFTDVDGDAIELYARQADGSQLPSWLYFDGTKFFGTAPGGYSGTLELEVIAYDGQLGMSDFFNFSVTSPPPPPPSSGKPIVIDLDGDGVEITEQNDSFTLFDFDDDGYREHTAWAGSDDGLLMFDLEDDGQVTRAREIAFAQWADDDPNSEGGITDLQGLANYFDINNDGELNALDNVFDSNDKLVELGLMEEGQNVWDSFKVWQDKNADGVVDEGELASLADLNITNLDLGYSDDTSKTLADGTQIFGYIDVQIDGEIQTAADVGFAYTALGEGESVLGDDTFVFADNLGHDTIVGFQAGANSDDVIDFSGLSNFATYQNVLDAAVEDGTDTTITIDANNSIALNNVVMADLHQDDFRFV